MPAQTNTQLNTQATEVRNETVKKANTAQRVGQLFINIIASMINIDAIDTDITLAANSDVKLGSQKAVKAYVDGKTALIGTSVPGTIDLWGGTHASLPTGWLLCNGAEVLRATYPALFTAIGTTHGAGNGTTTFNLPNIGERVVAGYKAATTGYDAAGLTGGAGAATLTDQQIAHKHTYIKYDQAGATAEGDGGPSDFSFITVDTSSIGNPAIARDPIDTRDKFIVLPYKIKT